MDNTTVLNYFCLVAQLKSFTKAAQQLELSPSAISQAIQQLENRLQVRLLHRTTRSISLTEAGQQLYNRIQPTLEEITYVLESLKQQQHQPSGTIKITTPYIAWKSLLYPKLDEFTTLYPSINLDIQINDGLIDLVAEGFDIGIRSTRNLHDTMIAVSLENPVKSCVVGSLNYFSKHPLPKIPNDLNLQKCIGYRFTSSQKIYPWVFTKKNQTVTLYPPHQLVVNDEVALIQLAKMGKGLAYVFEDNDVREAIQKGQLIKVLDDWQTISSQFYLYYPNRKYLPSKLSIFIDFLRTKK